MELNGKEKLILLMLAEIYEKLGINGEIDPAFIKEVIFSNHSWGLHWQYSALFEGEKAEDPPEVREVVEILDMWDLIELSFEELDPAERDRAQAEADPHGRSFNFSGFDGNSETKHMSIARFFVDHLGRWSRFEEREMNSHRRTVDEYRRMLGVYLPIRDALGSSGSYRLSADQLIQILKAR
jgi:uncharacterized protein YfbU (UPF0304 family)